MAANEHHTSPYGSNNFLGDLRSGWADLAKSTCSFRGRLARGSSMIYELNIPGLGKTLSNARTK